MAPWSHDPFALSAPTLRRGVSKGQYDSVFGWADTSIDVKIACAPRYAPVKAPALLRVNGLSRPLKSEQLQGRVPRHTTRSPRVPRRFVGVYRGGRKAQPLGAADTSIDVKVACALRYAPVEHRRYAG